ncbi:MULTISPECIES: PLP-dependent aminotransferase family protein [unclassified Pseudomonas]|uniref:aminotransferase-like domain-containing protein n=1 Tax=unclassified Pseudomonas TaxID=196821 RepID=UPI0015A40972|nr:MULTISPECIES: PLP-dependent aminotransferase family protein [unclassified Pseudomonas]NWC92483.1 PLP-dependent aminotransferase family protein [Pseudomonas sp. IPO3779]NWD15857.1 PLP-dependent aminotransferase family protein [Pseudomonas sp. IPO3778]
MNPKDVRQTDFAYQAVYRYMINLINEVGTDARVKLPSLRQLSERLNVSISTIQYAYSLLEKEGRVYSVAKSGYYAWPVVHKPAGSSGGDLLERVYASARRPGALVLSADEPALGASLDGALLLMERELLRHYPRHLQPWSQPCGVWELRAALAARYTSSPTRCWQADEVYIGADLRGVLEILIEVLGLKGATIIVESPCDWLILRLFQGEGVRIIEVPFTADGGLDLTLLEQSLSNEPVQLALLSSGASLPSGSVMSHHDRLQLVRLLNQHGCWLLENDSHGDLGFEHPITPLRDVANPERLMVFSTFEKTLGPEAPFGYLLSRHLSGELQRQFLLRAFRLSSIRQRAIARLYHSGRIDQHLRELRPQLKEQARLMSLRLDEHLGDQVSYRMPAAGATFWLRSRLAVDMRQVFQRLLACQVVIAPGELFSISGLHRQHLRVSHTFDRAHNLEDALGELSLALKQAQTG